MRYIVRMWPYPLAAGYETTTHYEVHDLQQNKVVCVCLDGGVAHNIKDMLDAGTEKTPD